MNQEQIDYAVRQALKLFDEWNDVSGCFDPPGGCSQYSELIGVITEAVHCGIQTALFGNVKIENGEVVKPRLKEPNTEKFLKDLETFEKKSKDTKIWISSSRHTGIVESVPLSRYVSANEKGEFIFSSKADKEQYTCQLCGSKIDADKSVFGCPNCGE